MNDEEEWDADFLDQLIQVEELALSSATQPQPKPPQLPPPPPPPPPQPSLKYDTNFLSYSPPRELSQRTVFTATTNRPSFDCSINGATVCPPTTSRGVGTSAANTDITKDHEIEMLKRELGRVTKQLMDMEDECSKLRKERDKNVLQLSGRETRDGISDNHVVSQQLKRPTTLPAPNSSGLNQACKEKGVQTDKAADFTYVTSVEQLHTHLRSNKLFAIWGSQTDQKSKRNMIYKLFTSCLADFHVIFGSFCTAESISQAEKNCSNFSFQSQTLPIHTSEAVKVAHLYSVVTKVTKEHSPLEALLEPLLDLCSIDNVKIVQKAMHILRMILRHFVCFERNSERSVLFDEISLPAEGNLENSIVWTCEYTLLRENVMVEGLHSQDNTPSFLASEGASNKSQITLNSDGTLYTNLIPRIPDADFLAKSKWKGNIAVEVPSINWFLIFEAMCKISLRHKEERIRLEAVALMSLILMRANALVIREKFGKKLVFECISQLLKKEAGSQVQNQVVRLLFLLLNCPKLLAVFCASWKMEGDDASATDNNCRDTLTSQQLITILDGLADCIAFCKNDLQDLILRRNVITALSFLASSGRSGFEILSMHKLSKDTNFLMLILQLLVSEMDVEAADCSASLDIIKERTLLIREVLILLNRLVSNSSYSSTSLQLLTRSRDMAGLTIDIANRLSRRKYTLGKPERLIREPDIVDLARLFKKRVFAYLGDPV